MIKRSKLTHNYALLAGKVTEAQVPSYIVQTMLLLSEFLSHVNKKARDLQEMGTGGAIHVINQCSITVVDTKFSHNYAEKDGGAVFGGLNIEIDLYNSTFVENKAKFGGVIKMLINAKLTITKCNFVRNGEVEAVSHLTNGTLNINRSYFMDHSGGDGGAIFISRSVDLTINNTQFLEIVA